jgi:flagellar assembly protein FliH
MNMKSFSRIYSRGSSLQLDTWSLTDLDVEPAESRTDLREEQILEIFRNGLGIRADKQEKRPGSALHSMSADLSAIAWQPTELGVQPQAQVAKDWFFIESISDPHRILQQEVWDEESRPDEEELTILNQARAKADEILLEARSAAEKVLLQARDEIEVEKKMGYQQGWNEARSEFGDALKAAHALVEEIREWQTVLMAQGEQILVEMLKEISQAMFGDGINLDANALRINLNRIMESAQGLGDLNIFLNPRDAKLLDASWSEYQLLVSGNKVRIIPSEKITPGGCMVKGNMGTVDARVETQLAAVLNTFEEIRESDK